MGDVLAWAAKKTIGEFGGYSKEISFVQIYIGIIYEPHSGSKKNRQVDVIISNKTKEVLRFCFEVAAVITYVISKV